MEFQASPSSLEFSICEEPGMVIELSETAQRRAGDCLPENTVIPLPEKVSLDLRRNDLRALEKVWKGH